MIEFCKALSSEQEAFLIIAFKFASIALANEANAPLVLCALYLSTLIPDNLSTLRMLIYIYIYIYIYLVYSTLLQCCVYCVQLLCSVVYLCVYTVCPCVGLLILYRPIFYHWPAHPAGWCYIICMWLL